MRTSVEVSNIAFNYLANALSQMCDGRLEALLHLPGAGATNRLRLPYASTFFAEGDFFAEGRPKRLVTLSVPGIFSRHWS
jgi:hypothetical protein